jgi:hypothetical protein
MENTAGTETQTFTVTRTERNGRHVYSVNGVELRTSAKAYDFAVTGDGNEYDPSGYFLVFRSTFPAAVKEAAKFDGCHAVQIVTA